MYLLSQVSEVSRNLTKPARDLRWPRKVSCVMSVRPRTPGVGPPIERSYLDDIARRRDYAAAGVTGMNRAKLRTITGGDTRRADFWAVSHKTGLSFMVSPHQRLIFFQNPLLYVFSEPPKLFLWKTISIWVSTGKCIDVRASSQRAATAGARLFFWRHLNPITQSCTIGDKDLLVVITNWGHELP